MSKLQEACARVNRAIAKAVTSCGCLKIEATKQPIPEEASLREIADYVETHITGELCPACREVIESELGSNLFYLAAACTLLNLDLEQVMSRENDRIATLGLYSLT
jgi:hypothetical protein